MQQIQTPLGLFRIGGRQQSMWKPRSHESQNSIKCPRLESEQTEHLLHSMHCHRIVFTFSVKEEENFKQLG